VRFWITLVVDGQEIEVASRNLSLKGLACTPHPRLREKVCCKVIISLAPDVQTVIKGQVVRVGADEVAIDFLAMNLESFLHLKKIVECHSRRPEAVAGELLTPAFPLSEPRAPVKKFLKKSH
jgi:hypothetical protein